jgi:cyclohexyl-isocyanide hydratase
MFPQLTQLDLTGPYEVFARMPETKVLLLAATLEPVRTEKGLTILPDCTFADCPDLDVICVPGGPGINPRLSDESFLTFLQEKGSPARYVTSVCTGALLLARAGLLDGYKATTHWLSLDLLRQLGVEVVEDRVVKDGNRITGGGVTAGIDFGLYIAAELFGEETAQSIQLMMEYQPNPPFESGHPTSAKPAIVEQVRHTAAPYQKEREQIIKRLL